MSHAHGTWTCNGTVHGHVMEAMEHGHVMEVGAYGHAMAAMGHGHVMDMGCEHVVEVCARH